MIVWLRKLAELILLFGALYAADRLGVGGGTGFVALQPNPYWLPVLAFSLAYGSGMGLIATAVATAIWLAAPHSWPKHYDHLAIQLHLSTLPLLWAVTALIVGEITGSRQRRMRLSEERADKLENEGRKVAEALARVSKINRELQVRIVNGQYIAGEALTAASDLLVAGQPDQKVALAKLISLAIESDDFTYYELIGDRMTPLLSGMGTQNRRLTTPVRWPGAGFSKNVVVHANQKANRVALTGLGVAAIPVTDPDGERVIAVLIIHSLPHMRFNPAKIAELLHLSHALSRYGEVFAKPSLRLAEQSWTEGKVA